MRPGYLLHVLALCYLCVVLVRRKKVFKGFFTAISLVVSAGNSWAMGLLSYEYSVHNTGSERKEALNVTVTPHIREEKDHWHRFCLLSSEARWDRLVPGIALGHLDEMKKMRMWPNGCDQNSAKFESSITSCPIFHNLGSDHNVLEQLHTHIVLFPSVACCNWIFVSRVANSRTFDRAEG